MLPEIATFGVDYVAEQADAQSSCKKHAVDPSRQGQKGSTVGRSAKANACAIDV